MPHINTTCETETVVIAQTEDIRKKIDKLEYKLQDSSPLS